jgi:ATP-dependent DNA helicase RecG
MAGYQPSKQMKESETVEFKRSTSELKEAIISIVSILNKHGQGEIYFGLRNDGQVVGQEVTERTIREVSKAVADHVEPVIFPQVERLALSGKSCVKVSFSGSDKPYFAFGRAYLRVGDENRQLSSPELKRMIVEQSKRQWEKEVSSKGVNDANVRLVKDFVKRANAAKRISFPFTSTRAVLDKLHLLLFF